VIRSFANACTEDIFNIIDSQRARATCPPALWSVVRRKLAMVNYARDLRELSVPAGNRLELLRGDRAGRYSIRVNARYRICFRWEDGDAFEVEVTDYH
jgi:proteic killer suppression protein